MTSEPLQLQDNTTQGRSEIDLVIEYRDKVIALEIKSGSRFDRYDLASLQNFARRTPQCVACILAYNGTEVIQLDKQSWAIPLGKILA